MEENVSADKFFSHLILTLFIKVLAENVNDIICYKMAQWISTVLITLNSYSFQN